jgi:hypothetical protein
VFPLTLSMLIFSSYPKSPPSWLIQNNVTNYS